MSRGLGVFQRSILAALEAQPDLLLCELALTLYGWPYSNVQKANMLQALGTLQKRALIEVYAVDNRGFDAQAVRLPSAAPRRFPLKPGSVVPEDPQTYVTLSPYMLAQYWPQAV
jgi:hypothetical protein